MNALSKTNYVLALTALFWAFDNLFAYVLQKSNLQEKKPSWNKPWVARHLQAGGAHPRKRSHEHTWIGNLFLPRCFWQSWALWGFVKTGMWQRKKRQSQQHGEHFTQDTAGDANSHLLQSFHIRASKCFFWDATTVAAHCVLLQGEPFPALHFILFLPRNWHLFTSLSHNLKLTLLIWCNFTFRNLQ